MLDATRNGADRASQLTIGELLRVQARIKPDAIAVVDKGREYTYSHFNARTNQAANFLSARGVRHGDRIAVLSENRVEFVELMFAAAKLGVIICALNWRLAAAELRHCIDLVQPKLMFVSPRFSNLMSEATSGEARPVTFGNSYEDYLQAGSKGEPEIGARPEDGLLILYTSGTTGLPKGALMSHRAEVARMQVSCIDMSLAPGDAFVAWTPMFHMVSTEMLIQVMCLGGKVIIVDGYQLDVLLELIRTQPQWWLILLPGVIQEVVDALRQRNLTPAGLKRIGSMADLVPRHLLAEVTTLLRAPYANTFGSTESGIPPCSGGFIPIGASPDKLSKQQNVLCDLKLVDENDNEVPDGHAGEAAVRGPTVFSGYWNDPKANDAVFRGGWFHMGDVFVRNEQGTLDFTDRVKYLIKSGGENIYPAEIERILLSDPRVDEAIVVRKRDDHWGEIPIAFVSRNDKRLTAEDLLAACRKALAGYKMPKGVHFVSMDEWPRNVTGKIQRDKVEAWFASGIPVER